MRLFRPSVSLLSQEADGKVLESVRATVEVRTGQLSVLGHRSPDGVLTHTHSGLSGPEFLVSCLTNSPRTCCSLICLCNNVPVLSEKPKQALKPHFLVGFLLPVDSVILNVAFFADRLTLIHSVAQNLAFNTSRILRKLHCFVLVTMVMWTSSWTSEQWWTTSFFFIFFFYIRQPVCFCTLFRPRASEWRLKVTIWLVLHTSGTQRAFLEHDPATACERVVYEALGAK